MHREYAKGQAGRLPLAYRRHGYHDGQNENRLIADDSKSRFATIFAPRWSHRVEWNQLKTWQSGADAIRKIRRIVCCAGAFVNKGSRFKLRKRQITCQCVTLVKHLVAKAVY